MSAKKDKSQCPSFTCIRWGGTFNRRDKIFSIRLMPEDHKDIADLSKELGVSRHKLAKAVLLRGIKLLKTGED